MNSISVVLNVVLAVLVAVCHGQQSPLRTWPIESYMSRRVINKYDAAAFNWIQATLEERNLTQPEQILAFFQDMDRNLATNLTDSVEYNGKLISVGYELYELIRLGDDELKLAKNTLDNYIRLVEHVFGDLHVMSKSTPPTNNVGLFNYLRLYGLKKFTSFLRSDAEEIINSFREDTEMALDDLVSSQDDKKETSKDDSYLAELASNIDPVNGQFDAKELLEAAKRHREKGWDEKSSFLSTAIESNCDGLLFTLGNLLDVFNMIRLLSSESLSQVNLPDKLPKFNEYGRICHQLFREDARGRAEANIEKGLKCSLSKLVKKVTRSS